jgi:isopentenyl diphosphate isomerase/L-lactate dehydrogenase-like FMN-dependent dehydrogenase
MAAHRTEPLEGPLKEEPAHDLPVEPARPEDRVGIEDFERQARDRLPQMVYDYFAGAAGDEWTLRENVRAFDRWVLRPRVLVDVAKIDLSTTILGQPIPFPILLAPTAFQRLAHPDGELASARAAASVGTVMVLSTVSTVPLEEVAATGVDRWFQLYVMQDRSLAADLVHRAAAAGFRALVVTVDTPLLGPRLRDVRNRFTLPPDITMANLQGITMPGGSGPGGRSTGSDLADFFAAEHDASLSWKDIEWLRSLSPMPVVLKGVMTREDARLAAEAGVDGIIVSNHGGRQLDGVPAAIDALPEIADEVGDELDVMMDGGIRRGTDVLKALALGAKAVLIGRPYVWGLACDGEAGVRLIIEMLRDELILSMRLAGKSALAEVDRSVVAPASGVGRVQ